MISSDPSPPLIAGARRPINVMIMGAGSGIGLALVSRLTTSTGAATIHAVSRRACANNDLVALRRLHPERLHLVDADVTSEDDLQRLAESARELTPELHLVINTAGLLHDATLEPEKTIRQLTLAGIARSFAVNAFGPILLAKALMPLLRHGEPAVFASLSARVGSIGDNRLGGWYSYRAAKAAQNQLLKTFSIELGRINRRAVVLALHPGTTDTPLSKPFQANVPAPALFTSDDAAQKLLTVIATRTPADTGGFFSWDGTRIPW